MAASSAAKLMAACICPVAGTTALTLTVPEVRQAVHKATAPRAYAKPKVRVRQPAAEAAGVQAAAVAPCPTAVPVVLSGVELPTTDAVLPSLPALQTATNSGLPAARTIIPSSFVPGGGGGGGGGTGGGDPDPGPGPDTPLLPEPTTWMQLILGFGLIGGAIRMARHQSLARRQAARLSVTVRFAGITPESERPFA